MCCHQSMTFWSKKQPATEPVRRLAGRAVRVFVRGSLGGCFSGITCWAANQSVARVERAIFRGTKTRKIGCAQGDNKRKRHEKTQRRNNRAEGNALKGKGIAQLRALQGVDLPVRASQTRSEAPVSKTEVKNAERVQVTCVARSSRCCVRRRVTRDAWP